MSTLLIFVLIATFISNSVSQSINFASPNQQLTTSQAKLILNGFSSIFWNHIESVNGTQPSQVSSQCYQNLIGTVQSAYAGSPWAFKLLSASGKTPNSFLDGSYSTFGDYDSCLELHGDLINGGNVKGQYCLTSIEPDFDENNGNKKMFLEQLYQHNFDVDYNLTIKLGLCIPSSCSADDIAFILNQALSPFSWKLVNVNHCEVEANFIDQLSKATKGQKISFLIVSSLIGLVIAATFVDKHIRDNQSIVESEIVFWLRHFSLIKSTRNLFRKPNLKPRVYILDKFRLLVLFVVFGNHAIMWFTVLSAPFILDQSKRVTQLLQNFYAQPLFNDWETEFLIFLGGLSASVNLFYKMRPETPIRTYAWEIIRRGLIMLPPLSVVIALEIILPLFGSGPYYQSVNQYRSRVCEKNFLSNIFYFHNYCKTLEICASHTWSFSAELHLFAMACCAVFIYKRYPKAGLAFNVIMILFGFYRVAWLFHVYDIIPQLLIKSASYRVIIQRMESYYITTGAHIWSYFTALLVVKIMSDNLSDKMSQTTRSRATLIVTLLTVIQSFSTCIWNIFGAPIEPISRIIYVITYKVIAGLFFTLHIMRYEYQFRRFFSSLSGQKTNNITNSESPDKSLTDKSSSELNEFEEPTIGSNNNHGNQADELVAITNNNHNNDGLISANHSPSERKKSLSKSQIKSLHRAEVVSRLAKSAYFVHSIVYAWFYSSLRSPFSFSMINSFTLIGSLTTLAFIAGFFFHVIILGPLDSILYSLKTRQSHVKSHLS